jgi:F0F1-type ATP synthase delta subunit
MKIPRSTLAHVLTRKSLGSMNRQAFADEIAAYLLSERRTGELDSLMRDMIDYRSKDGIVEVRAISAHPITSRGLRDIEAEVRTVYPAAKHIIISTMHDNTVIGGVRLEFPNQQLDLSVHARLSHFKHLTTAGRN